MAYTPTLSEITSIKGDADLGNALSGESSALLPFNESMQFLSAAAQQKANNDMNRYIQFQKNLEQNMKGFNEMDMADLMEKDYDTILPKYVELAQDLADNYDIVRNPARNLTKFKELQGREKELREIIAKSKLQRKVLDEHQKFLNTHPDFLTDENKAAIESYQNETDPSRRSVFTFSPPYTYNPTNPIKEATIASEKVISDTVALKGQGYFQTTEGKQYLTDEYKKAFMAALQRRDSGNAGKTYMDVLRNQFNKAGGEQGMQITFDEWLDNHIESTIPQDYFSTKYSVDQKQINDTDEANAMKRHRDEMAYKYEALRQAKDLAKDKLDKDQEQLGDFLNDVVTSLYYDKTETKPAAVSAGGKIIQGGWMPNVSTATLELVGRTVNREIKSKDGKSVTKVEEVRQPADALFKTKDNKILPVFYKRKSDGKIALTKSGAIIFDDTKMPLTPDELKELVAKQAGGKDWQIIYSKASENVKKVTGSASLEGESGKTWFDSRALKKGEGALKTETIFDWNKK